MKRNKKYIISLIIIMCSIFIALLCYRRYSEVWIAKDYYESTLYKRFDGFSDYQKESYIKSLENNKISIKVSDLRRINSKYDSKLSHKNNYTLTYTIEEPYGITDYSFTYNRFKK